MEVESSVLGRLQNGPSPYLSPRCVAMPEDHGVLYEQKRFFQRADFMVRGGEDITFDSIGRRVSNSWQELLDSIAMRGYSLIIVPLQFPDNRSEGEQPAVVRAIIPGLVPMTFGYRQEPGGMRRIYTTGKKFGGSIKSYRDLPKFPHPFA